MGEADMALALETAVRSDVGRRPGNEDAAFASTRLAVVADGVGGAAAGEVASRTIVDAMISLDKRRLESSLEDAVSEAIAWGNQTIGFIAACRPATTGMSTTLTAVALGDDGAYVLANVGDSRTYLLRDGTLALLTHDESLVQALLDSGHLTSEEARGHPQRSLLLRSLDGEPDAREPALTTVAARAGDRLLLCSDGLSDVVDDGAIASALGDPSREACAERLISLALAAGGRDNVSVAVADVVARRDPADAWRA